MGDKNKPNTILDAKGKKMGSAAVMLLETEAATRKITFVNFGGNKLTDDNMKPLGEALLKAGVISVDLTKNKITSRGLVELAHSLRGNYTLQQIKLDSSRGTKQVEEAIETLLSQNRQLNDCTTGTSEELKMRGRGMRYFPAPLLNCDQIRRLDFSNNDVKRIPFEIVQLSQLEILVLENNLLTNLPLHLCQLSHLSKLRLQNNKIKRLPGELCMMAALEDIDVRDNHITRVPLPLSRKLKVLKISGNNLALPPDIQGDDARVLDFLQKQAAQRPDGHSESLDDDSSDYTDSSSSTASTNSTSTAASAVIAVMSAEALAGKLRKNKAFMLDALIVEVKAGAVGNQQSLLDSIIYILCYFEAFTIAVEKLLRLELKNLSDHQLLFRADSFTTRLVARYMAILGSMYLSKLVSPVVEMIMEEAVELEVAPEKVASKKELAKNQERLLFLSDVFLNSVFLSSTIPIGIRKILNVIQRVTQMYFPEYVEQCLGNFFFLRFLCPQIVTVDCPKERAKRTIVLIAKLLQNLANETHFTKESGMEFFDGFIDKNVPRLKVFYEELTQVDMKRDRGGSAPIPLICHQDATEDGLTDPAMSPRTEVPDVGDSALLRVVAEREKDRNKKKNAKREKRETSEKSEKSDDSSKKGKKEKGEKKEKKKKPKKEKKSDSKKSTSTIIATTTTTTTTSSTSKTSTTVSFSDSPSSSPSMPRSVSEMQPPVTPPATSPTLPKSVSEPNSSSTTLSGAPIAPHRRRGHTPVRHAFILSETRSRGDNSRRSPLEQALETLYVAVKTKKTESGGVSRYGTLTKQQAQLPPQQPQQQELRNSADKSDEAFFRQARCLRATLLKCMRYYDDDTSSAMLDLGG